MEVYTTRFQAMQAALQLQPTDAVQLLEYAEAIRTYLEAGEDKKDAD